MTEDRAEGRVARVESFAREVNIDPAEIDGALLSGVAHPSDSVGRLFPRSLFLFSTHVERTNNRSRGTARGPNGVR